MLNSVPNLLAVKIVEAIAESGSSTVDAAALSQHLGVEEQLVRRQLRNVVEDGLVNGNAINTHTFADQRPGLGILLSANVTVKGETFLGCWREPYTDLVNVVQRRVDAAESISERNVWTGLREALTNVGNASVNQLFMEALGEQATKR